jgi:AhpD family alkylhydroperoxidase
MSTAQRIAPGGRRDVGLFTWGFAQIAGAVSRTEPQKLFLTMGRHRRLFRGWLRFAGRLMPGGKLPRRDTELVILRVAHLRSCAYEWEHHVRLGRRAGLSHEEIERVRSDPPAPGAAGWAPREAALLTAVDELHADGDVTDATWAALRAHYDDRRLIELVLLAGHYEMLATAITALRIEPDRKRGRS